MKGGTNPASESLDIARNHSLEAGRTRRGSESTARCPPTNPVKTGERRYGPQASNVEQAS